MKLNNKGFALTSMIYMLLVLFLMVMLLLLANLAQRKVVLDKLKHDVVNKLDQGVIINASELPYQNETTGIYYETLESAFNKTNSGETIKVQKNVTDETVPTLAEGKTITLDLNGNTITRNNKRITNNGNLTITDTKGNGSIKGSERIITNNKELIITGNLEINSNATSTTTIINDGFLEVNGATISSTNNRAITNANTVSTARVTIKSGTISSKQAAIYNYDSSQNTIETPAVKIENGTIESTNNHAVYNRKGMVYITGGTFRTNTTTTINNAGNGTIEMTGGTVTSTTLYGINNSGDTADKEGIINIRGGTIRSTNSYAVRNTSIGTINISGGTIIGENANAVRNNSTGIINITGGEMKSETKEGVYNYSNGTINMSGGTVKSNASSGFTIYNGTLNITGGTVIGTTAGVYLSHTNGTSAQLILGNDNDGTFSTTTPSITATNTTGKGVSINKGKFYFYDGVVKGGYSESTGYSITGTVTGWANGYNITKTHSENVETAILSAS